MNKTAVVVQVEVAVGNRYLIHSSYGFAGIEEGAVEVVDIVGQNDTPVSDEVAMVLGAQTDIWVDSDMMSPQEASTTTWVVYQDEAKELYALPVDLFVQHTTTL